MTQSRTVRWGGAVFALLAAFYLGTLAVDWDLLNSDEAKESTWEGTDPAVRPERPGLPGTFDSPGEAEQEPEPLAEAAPSLRPALPNGAGAPPPEPSPPCPPPPPPMPTPTAEERVLLARARANPAIPRDIHDILERLAPADRVSLYDTMDHQQRRVDALSQANSRLRTELEEGADPADPESAARAGKLRFSLHESGLSEQPLDESLITDLGLSAADRAAVEDMLRAQTDGLYDELHGLLVEQTGNPAAGMGYNTVALIEAIREAASREDFSAAIDLIAREVAGQTAPPSDPHSGSVAERMLRAAMSHDRSVRDALVRLLGEELADAFMNHASNKGTFYSFEASGGAL